MGASRLRKERDTGLSELRSAQAETLATRLVAVAGGHMKNIVVYCILDF